MVQFASYLRRVLCKTRLIFPRINQYIWPRTGIHKDSRLNSNTEDIGENFALAKSSPIAAVNLHQKSRIPHCNLTWIDCKIETYKIA